MIFRKRAERGPYPLVLADALNILVEIERHAEETDGAIKAASQTFCTSWCDGPPFVYHCGSESKEAIERNGSVSTQNGVLFETNSNLWFRSIPIPLTLMQLK